MYRYEKILVYLNTQDDEREVIEMAGKISQLAQSKQLVFSHFCDVTEIPDDVKGKYPWLMKPLDKAVKSKLDADIGQFCQPYAGAKVETRVSEGHPIYKLLEIARKDDIDLIILGISDDDTELAIRLARKAPCSVMAVPAKAKVDFQRVLVTVDFSKYSEYSIDVATAFAQAQQLSAITALHVSLLPTGRKKGILPESAYVELNEPFFKEKLDTFLKPLNKHNIAVEPQVVHAYDVGQGVGNYIQEGEVDLVITGCRGKDALSSLLLGSNAESIIEVAKIPVIAVKEKGTGHSFLDNLLGMVGK